MSRDIPTVIIMIIREMMLMNNNNKCSHFTGSFCLQKLLNQLVVGTSTRSTQSMATSTFMKTTRMTCVDEDIISEDVLTETITSVSQKLRSREVASSSLTKVSLKRISDTKALNSFITVMQDEAVKAAEASDLRFMQSEYHFFPISFSLVVFATGITCHGHCDRVIRHHY